MPLVAFDANTCIWGIKQQATAGQGNMIGLADTLIKTLTKHSVDILLPAPVVSELMRGMTPPQSISFYGMLDKKFEIGEFDAKATVVLGEILNHHYSIGKYKTLGISKTAMKYDAYIIAIAVSKGVECIYSEDPDFTTIAAHFVPIHTLTKLPQSILKNDGSLIS